MQAEKKEVENERAVKVRQRLRMKQNALSFSPPALEVSMDRYIDNDDPKDKERLFAVPLHPRLQDCLTVPARVGSVQCALYARGRA